jgi:signal transduction histidine kinase
MNKKNTFKIRPAGRHLLTIGEDLIQDAYAAVIELVKNAYDADSPDVRISINKKKDNNEYTIVILDHGHGMTLETVKNRWLVPSTPDKKERRISPSGRVMQGSKGIGRYASAILGDNLELITITAKGEKNVISINWSDFNKAEYLDDVPVIVETVSSKEKSGTKLTITGNSLIWDKDRFDKLRFELKKLIPPIKIKSKDEKFLIYLNITGFNDYNNIKEKIEPFPIMDFFDYRISGHINTRGKGSLVYSSQKARNIADEEIQIDLGQPTKCGKLDFDIRAYDRDKESIESLINRGLTDSDKNYLSNQEARKVLNDYNGIGVYRNGFRIRPLGDAEFDWLKLNKRRVQNPSRCIGSDQFIGYVFIESEEKSGLIEKSARDGLKVNTSYDALIEATISVIAKLEEKRFKFRKDTGLGRTGRNINKRLDALYFNEELRKEIITQLKKHRLKNEILDEIGNTFDNDADKKAKLADEIRDAVGIYQGQATLGKIINVILHEGRRPLNFFKNQIPNLQFWYNTLLKSKNTGDYKEFLSIADSFGLNAEILVTLFSRIDPLAMGKRARKNILNLKEAIVKNFSIFNNEMKAANIRFTISGPDDFKYQAWQQDIYAIFTNLIDNSIYWIKEKKCKKRNISVNIVLNGGDLSYIDYRDSGPGIEPDLIADEIIFEPDFSTKPNGTGLGLAIAGEAALRNNLELKVYESDQGAYFRLQLKQNTEAKK